MMFERDVARAQRRGRRKVQASAQDLLILVERIVIPAPHTGFAEPGKCRRFTLAACLAWRTPTRVNRQRTEAGLPI
jgi:hypothetical protein